ncbi:nusA N-terminal domain protein [Streptococcus pneumoniae GA16833]|nr:nusA N-terminal domain protein [Streptococcus pneumoniae GA16833]
MSKEMLEAFRILEEDKGIKKEDIIDAVVESLRSAYRRRYGQSDSVAIDFNEKQVTLQFILSVKLLMKYLIAVWKSV